MNARFRSWSAVLAALLLFQPALRATRAADEEARLAFLSQANKYYAELDEHALGIESRIARLRPLLEMMYMLYDNITFMGPDDKRPGFVAQYDHERGDLYADFDNMMSKVRKLEPTVEKVEQFLALNREYDTSSAWTDLDKRATRARHAIDEARRLSRPPALPDPLPDAPRRDAEKGEVRFESDPVVGKPCKFEVDLINHRRFTATTVRLEVRVRAGAAKLANADDETGTFLFRSFEIPSQRTTTVSFPFTRLTDDPLDIGARIAPKEADK
jgi:hypothetical protein